MARGAAALGEAGGLMGRAKISTGVGVGVGVGEGVGDGEGLGDGVGEGLGGAAGEGLGDGAVVAGARARRAGIRTAARAATSSAAARSNRNFFIGFLLYDAAGRRARWKGPEAGQGGDAGTKMGFHTQKPCFEQILLAGKRYNRVN